MNKAHGVYGIQGQDDLGDVEPGPVLGHVVVGHQVDEVTPGHVVHDHVEVLVILESKMKLDDPFGIGMSHDITLFPKESTVATFDLEIKIVV